MHTTTIPRRNLFGDTPRQALVRLIVNAAILGFLLQQRTTCIGLSDPPTPITPVAAPTPSRTHLRTIQLISSFDHRSPMNATEFTVTARQPGGAPFSVFPTMSFRGSCVTGVEFTDDYLDSLRIDRSKPLYLRITAPNADPFLLTWTPDQLR